MRLPAVSRWMALGLVASAAIGPAAGAAGLTLEAPVGFAQGASLPERVRSECAVDSVLGTALTETLKAAARPTDAGTPSARLKVEITQVFAQGGGSWSGSKAIMLDAVLTMDGQPPLSRKFDRWYTSKPIVPLARSNCYILEGLAKALAKDVSRWAVRAVAAMPEALPPADHRTGS